MYINIYIDMYIDSHVYGHVYRHVDRHVYRHGAYQLSCRETIPVRHAIGRCARSFFAWLSD